MANLKLKGVNKVYPNGVQAVFDFNVDIKDKEFIVFVGPSGCGKSTTLRMVAGLETITSGEFYIDGQLMNSVEPKDRNIAMVFQNYALYPHFTVYENLRFALKLRKVPRPIYTNLEDPEIVALTKENQELFATANKYNRQFKKKQYDDNLLVERREVYKKIFENEEKLQGLYVQAVGIDEYSINKATKLIAKLKKDIAHNEKIISRYVEDYPEETKRFVESNENIAKQIKNVEEKLEYLKTHEVPLNQVRHLTKYEMDLEINKAADSIDLERYLYRKPAALSGGQRQRVALGRAIVRKPAVFLMDEPLSNLDAKLRVQTRSEIIKIHERVGATTIYVTHDQTEAMTMADRIVVMKDGYIQQVGAPKELFKDPANKFVASFIGSPAMNFISGTYSNGVFKGEMKEGLVEAVGNESFEYEVPSAYKEMLTPYEGKKVILGVRPEDIEIKKATGKKSGGTLVNCDYVELLGYDLMVYAYILGNKIVVKSEENTGIAMGDDGYITFKEDAVYFFDGETEQRIR